MSFGERLIQLRKERGYKTRKDFADVLGIPETTLRNYENETREPGHTFLKQVSNLLNVSIDYLLCQTDLMEVLKEFKITDSEQKVIIKYRCLDKHGKDIMVIILNEEYKRCIKPIPAKRIYTYLHRIAAAGNGFLIDDIPVDVIEVPEMPGADFVIGVNGDSMEPTYLDGDMVYVQRANSINVGEIGIFIFCGECFIKELSKDGLVSHNKKYPLIKGDSDITVVGRVLGKVVDE